MRIISKKPSIFSIGLKLLNPAAAKSYSINTCSVDFPEIEPKPWDATWNGGFFCPCHGSMFDIVGRVFKGVPAPTNLIVPPHMFDGSILTIGEDKEL